jgi:TonB family protein
VRLAVRVEADGRLSQIALARSSGHRLLDAAALASARSIPPLVQAVALLAGSALDTVVPIRYRLTEG